VCKDLPCLLLYPPLSDPTSGYHSLLYLDAAARSHGFHAIDIIDSNIGAVHHLSRPEDVEKLKLRGEKYRSVSVGY